MKHEGSLPCSQKPATGLYPELDAPVHTLPHNLLKNHFNIILPSTPRFENTSTSLVFHVLYTEYYKHGDGAKSWVHIRENVF
jgi:hypothetical protein